MAKNITTKALQELMGDDAVKKGIPAFIKRRAFIPSIAEGTGKTVFTFGRGFFYKHGKEAADWAATVLTQLTDAGYGAELIASGENWAEFTGGAKPMTAKASFWWAAVSVTSR